MCHPPRPVKHSSDRPSSEGGFLRQALFFPPVMPPEDKDKGEVSERVLKRRKAASDKRAVWDSVWDVRRLERVIL